MKALWLLPVLALVACSRPAEPAKVEAPSAAPVTAEPAPAPPKPATEYPTVEPPAPGAPGGLPDDRTPISEAPFTPQSAQGASNVVQTYYALIGEKKFAEAWRLWSDDGKASGESEQAFIARMSKYLQYNAQTGAPGEIEGAAGSLYVEVPVVIYGRNPDGSELHQSGKATLRRVNDVDGSTPEQRKWHISQIELKP